MHADDVFDVVEKLNSAGSDAEVLKLLRRASREVGYEHFIVSGLPPRGIDVLPFVLIEDWPSEWHQRYFGLNYTQFDPVARHCFHTVLPFFWADAPYDDDDRSALRVMDEAAGCGLDGGYCVPVHNEDGSQGCISFGGGPTELEAPDQLALHLISSYAHGRLRWFRRQSRRSDAPKLTARETEVLKWASLGKSTQDISEVLGIANVTVDTHVASAARKLGTLNRVHTVAEALRYNLLPL